MVLLPLLPSALQLPFWSNCTASYGDVISEVEYCSLYNFSKVIWINSQPTSQKEQQMTVCYINPHVGHLNHWRYHTFSIIQKQPHLSQTLPGMWRLSLMGMNWGETTWLLTDADYFWTWKSLYVLMLAHSEQGPRKRLEKWCLPQHLACEFLPKLHRYQVGLLLLPLCQNHSVGWHSL